MIKKSLWLVLSYTLLTSLAAPLLISLIYLPIRFLQGEQVSMFELDIEMLLWATITGQCMVWCMLWMMREVTAVWNTAQRVGLIQMICCLIGMFAAVILTGILMQHCQSLPDWNGESIVELLHGSWGILLIIFFAPALEEFVFRGVILRWLSTKYSPCLSLFISSLLFALAHFNPIQMLPAFLLSLPMGWVYLKCRDIRPVICMHVLNNTFSVWFFYHYGEEAVLPDIAHLSEETIIILSVALLTASLLGFQYITHRRQTSQEDAAGC